LPPVVRGWQPVPMLRSSSLALAVLLLAPTVASADAVGPPPSMCPEGSTAVGFCHGPPTCEIADCSGDADCEAGEVCAPRNLCVVEHCCSGRCCGGMCSDPPTVYDHISGPCAAGGTCSGFGESCETRRVCVEATGMDAGVDAGTEDAGTDAGGTDAGDTETDAGGADDDAGSAAMDAGGSTGMDASSGGVDAGDEGGSSDGGCGCGVADRPAAPGVGLLLIGLAMLSLRRARR